MNLAETHDLLTYVASVDNRRFDDATVMAWQQILTEPSFADCRAAAAKHFATSVEYLMPVHVRLGALEIDRTRRRVTRELAEAAEQRAIEADPTRRDRSADVAALIAGLRQRLPAVDPAVTRRPEWLRSDRQRRRWPVEPPNPHYDPAALSRLATMLAELEAGATP